MIFEKIKNQVLQNLNFLQLCIFTMEIVFCKFLCSNLPWHELLKKYCVCFFVVPQLSFQVKVGVMYCRAGQSTEEEMYNNETAGPALEEFLQLLGDKVRLKGFTKYRAQLDTKSNNLKHLTHFRVPHTNSLLTHAVMHL